MRRGWPLGKADIFGLEKSLAPSTGDTWAKRTSILSHKGAFPAGTFDKTLAWG